MLRTLLMAAAAFAAMAAPAAAQIQTDTAAALVRVTPAPVDGATRTAAARQVMYEQAAHVSEVVRLRAPLAATFPLGGTQAEMALPAGAELFRVRFQTNASLTGYCAAETMRTGVGAHRPARVGRICLSDSDTDGAFDRLWYMFVPISASGDGAGGWVIHPYSRIAGGLVYSVTADQLAPIGYEAAPQHAIAPFSLAIEHVPWGRGFAFQPRQRDGDGNALTELGTEITGAQRAQADAEFPQTLSLMGAEIEILSRDEAGALSYRVRRGFSESQALELVSVPPPAPPPPSAPPPRR